MKSTRPQAVILEVVRGERPWTDVQDLGIHVSVERTEHGHLKAEVDNPKRLSTIADAGDLAQGLLRYQTDHEQLRTWAFVLESGDFVEFDVTDCPDGESLLDALWDASYGKELDPAARRLAQELVSANATPST